MATPTTTDNQPSLPMLIVGAVVFLATIGAWLYAESLGIDTGVLITFAVPVIGALFLARPVARAADAAAQAAAQTNGVLDARVKAAVSAALADRDAARTRQAKGDIDTSPIEHRVRVIDDSDGNPA